MAAIAAVPFVLKDVIFQVGTDTFEAAVQSARFVPTYNTIKAKGLTPTATYADVDTPEWEVTVSFLQDWTTTGSLSNYLFTNSGTSKTVVFKPNGVATGKPIWTATVTVVSGDIGGDQGKFADTSVTMAVSGQPVKTIAP